MLAIAVSLLFLSSCARREEALRVGDLSYDRQELSEILRPVAGDSQAVENRLQSFIAGRLILVDADARGITGDRIVTEQLWERSRERLQAAYISAKLGAIVIPEDSVTAFYDASGTMLQYTVMNVADSALADSLRTLVLAGEDMSGLVRRFSTLSVDVETGGLVGPRDSMRTSAADGMLLAGLSRGEVSPVARFDSGWRFLRLDSIYQAPMPRFEEARQGIYDFIWGHEAEIYKVGLEDSLRSAYSIRVPEGAVDLLVSHALTPSGEFSPYSPEEDSTIVCEWDGGHRTAGFVARNIIAIPSFLPRDATDSSWVDGYVRLLGLYDVMATRAVEMGLDTIPETAALVTQAREGVILEAWRSRVLLPRISPDEQQIVASYEAHRAALVIPERRRLRAIAAVDEAQVARLESLLSAGGDPLDSPDLFTPVRSLLEEGETVLTRPLAASDLPPEIASEVASLEPGEARACSLSGGSVLYMALEEVIPARQATLEEARESIAAALSDSTERVMLRGLVDSLRSAYPCRVDSEFVSRFWSPSQR